MTNLPWVEKYRPKSQKDLVGNKLAIQNLRKFLINWSANKSKPAIILVGPPGCGKTSATHALAQDLNFIVTEVNASDTRSKNHIRQSLRLTSEFMRLDFADKKQLILMDEIDGLSGRYDRGGLNEFMKILKSTKYPIVCTANDPDSDKILTLTSRMKLRKLTFYRLDEFEVVELLEEINKMEKVTMDETILERIAENASGDIRAAINELESFHYGKDLTNLEKRDKAKQLIEIFNDLFRAKNYHEGTRAWFNAPSNYLPLLLHLFDQTSKQCKTSTDLYQSYWQIANADLVLSRIVKTQNWGLLKYFFSFIGPGIVLSRENKYFNRIQNIPKLPNQFKLRGIVKNKNKKASEIAPKVVNALHISERKFIYQEFDLFVKIITGNNGAEIAAWLDLDDNMLEILQKLNPDSNLIDDIEEAREKIGEERRKQGLKVQIDPLLEEFNSIDIIGSSDEDIVLYKDREKNDIADESVQADGQQSLDDFF